MSTPARFSDGQYKNWLKCSQSLILMKKALHDYTDNEVRKLHGDITQKVSSIPCASTTGNQCGSCSSKNIRLTGHPRNWFISCKNNICDKWLQQILAVHDNPHNPSINWKNADISLWPIDCYQVAKIFMPKGQDKTAKMPDDLKVPAILSLLKYCNWFRKDLPNTQILSDLMEIRNKLTHSGDLRVSYSDKDSWIDLMIQLLKDLKIQGDAIPDLETIKKEDNDIIFETTEIRLLPENVSGLVNDITTVKEDMVTMQNSVSVLSDEMEKVRDRTTETIGKVDAVKTDMEGIRKSLEEVRETEIQSLQEMVSGLVSDIKVKADIVTMQNSVSENMEKVGDRTPETIGNVYAVDTNMERIGKSAEKFLVIYGKLMSFFDKNPDIQKTTIIKDLQSNLSVLKARVSLLEKHEETNLQIKEKMEGIYERIAAFEKEKKLETETTRNKIPETGDLKAHTENRLDTDRELEFIPTEQAEKAEKLLAEKKSIVIKGNPGEGKTTLSLHLIDNEKFKDKRVVLNKPSQWEKVDTGSVAIVVLEDVFGQYDFDPGRFQEWMVHLPTIQKHVDVGKLQVIVTTRVDVLSEACNRSTRLRSLKLFSTEMSLTLSSEKLTDYEKISILKRELKINKKIMKEDEIKVCIANFGGLIGFPQCCSLFAGDIKLFDKGPNFFRSPKEFFVENIEDLEDKKLLSLSFLFCKQGEILVENLSSDRMTESSKQLLMELASSLNILEKDVSIESMKKDYANLGELYVVKSVLYDFSSMSVVEKSCIKFTHATVSEAVGHVLWNRCCKIVVKSGDSQYLYQRTYTAEEKDSTPEKVFLPEDVYGLLAERMVHDVVNRRLISSVVKHSALKRRDFIKILKDKLNKGNVLKDFFMAGKDEFETDTLSKGICVTFMQYILQGDKDVVRLVYNELLIFLTYAHNDSIHDCWWCEEKQNLLELALYYHHFEIADKLIAKKASYTHVSLCNAARHGDLQRIQIITESLKKNRVFNPEFTEAKYALYRAYVSGNQSLIEFLLKEGIVLDSWCVVNAVTDGDKNVLKKVVEHLIHHNKWNPDWKRKWIDGKYLAFFSRSIYQDWSKSFFDRKGSCFLALYLAYCNEQFPIVHYLLEKEVKVEMYMLVCVLEQSSQTASLKVIKDLKDRGTWNPHCDDASEALEKAYSLQKYDVYDLLVQDGVPLKMKNLPGVIMGVQRSSESLKKAIQHMKDTDNWDPMCDDASGALEKACIPEMHYVYDLLVQDGVSLQMKNLQGFIKGVEKISLESVKKAIQHLKETDNWDPNCDDASIALTAAICEQKDEVYDLLFHHGVSLKMKNLPAVIRGTKISESLKKAIQHMKDTDNWDPKCDDASEALEAAICEKNDDVYDLLVKDEVSLKMKNLWNVTMRFWISLESIMMAIEHLKDTDNWDPECDYASGALKYAICKQKEEVYDLLVCDGVTLKMKHLPGVIMEVYEMSFESVKKAIQHLKETGNWDPKCDDASEALEVAYFRKKYDVFDLLVKDGVSLKMKNLLHVIMLPYKMSLESFKKVIQHLKGTENWDPNSEDASEALAVAICKQKYDVYYLLVQNEVSLKMKNLPGIIMTSWISFDFIKTVIQHLKDTDNWDPNCDDASKALKAAICEQKDDVYDLLVENGASIKMKNLPCVIKEFEVSLEFVKKAIKHLKDNDNWDPECDDASKALETAICRKKYEVYDLLVKNGVSVKMKNLLFVILGSEISLKFLKKAIQHMKETGNWDPKCDDASNALESAIYRKKDDVYDLMVQDGVSLRMKNLINIILLLRMSLEPVTKAIKHLKETEIWDPKCDDASKALEVAIYRRKYHVFDLLVQDGVSLRMKNLPGVIKELKMLFESVTKTIQHLKETEIWDPKCDDASKALEVAIYGRKYHVFDLLVQDGVSLKMKNLSGVIWQSEISLESLKKAIHLKDTDNWDPKCDDASEALEVAIHRKKDDVYDLLVQNGVSLKMKNLLSIIMGVETISLSLEFVQKVIQHLKETDNWDPKCDDASKALEVAIYRWKYDVYDLLVQNGVSLKMKNLPGIIMICQVSLESVTKVIQHLKGTDNWDPKCDDASKALELACCQDRYDVVYLLVQEGVLLNDESSRYITQCNIGGN